MAIYVPKLEEDKQQEDSLRLANRDKSLNQSDQAVVEESKSSSSSAAASIVNKP